MRPGVHNKNENIISDMITYKTIYDQSIWVYLVTWYIGKNKTKNSQVVCI